MDYTSTFVLAIFSLIVGGWPLYTYLYPNLEVIEARSPFLWNDTAGKPIHPRDIHNYKQIFLNVSDQYELKSPVERLYDIIYHENLLHALVFQHEYSNLEDLIVSSEPVGNQTRCKQDIEKTLKLINSTPNFRTSKGKLNHQIVRYLGSFGKPKPRLFSGAPLWVGSYSSCLRSELEGVKMRYCWSRWRFNQWQRDIEKLTPRTYISVGACLPESCDSRALGSSRDNIRALVSYEWIDFYRKNMDLNELYCLPDERSPLVKPKSGTYVFIGVLASWVIIIIVATILHQKEVRDGEKQREGAVDVVKLAVLSELSGQTSDDREPMRNRHPSKLLESLSIMKAFKTLFNNKFKVDYKHSDPQGWPRVDLGCTNSIKFLMYALIVLGHTGCFRGYYHEPTEDAIEIMTGMGGSSLISFGNLVTTFFLVSALFSGYMVSGYVGKAPFWIVWLSFNVRAIVRILPVYYVVFAYAKLISPYLGSGPMWDYGTTSFSRRSMCAREGWNRLLHPIGRNILDPCVLQAWFLGVYFQLCLVIPIVVYLLTKLRGEKQRLIFVLFCSLSSSSLFNIRLTQQKSLDAESFSLFNGLLAELTLRFEKIASYDMTDQFGLAAIGCYLGNLLHRYSTEQVQHWPKCLESRLTIISLLILNPVLLLFQVFSYLLHQLTGKIATPLDIMIGNSLIAKLTWPIANGLLIILCSTTYKHYRAVRFFSHSFWFTANRLGLVIFLVHWEYLDFVYTWSDLSLNESFRMFVALSFTFVISFCIVTALPVHVLFEAPMSELLWTMYVRVIKIAARLSGPSNLQSKSNESTTESQRFTQDSIIQS